MITCGSIHALRPLFRHIMLLKHSNRTIWPVMGMVIISHESITAIHWISSYNSNLLTIIIRLIVCTFITWNCRSVSMFSAVDIFGIHEIMTHSQVMAHLMDKCLSWVRIITINNHNIIIIIFRYQILNADGSIWMF